MIHSHNAADDQINTAAAFMAGVVAGMIAGMLLAPRSGAELRDSLKDHATGALHDILDSSLRTAKNYVEDMVQRGKDYIDSAVEELVQPARIGQTRR
jgi:gas vesicle protein